MKRLSKSLFFRLHAWAGILFGPMLYVICLSGSFAVISNEIDWLLNDNRKSQIGEMNWDLVHEKFNESHPNYELTSVRAPRHKGFAAYSIAKTENGKTVKVFSNPVSGEVQSIESFWNVQRFFRSFHRRFFITPGPIGILLVSLYGIPLLILIILGVRVQGVKIIKLMYSLRGNRNKKKLWSNSHLLLSNWSWVFAAIIALTGIYYCFEVFKKPPSTKVDKSLNSNYKKSNNYDQIDNKINYLSRLSTGIINGFKVSSIGLDNKNDLITFYGKTPGSGIFFRPRGNIVAFKLSTGDLAWRYKIIDTTNHKIISDIADPIHFGVWGGLSTQIIWFILGLILSFAIMAGLILATKRIPTKYHPSKFTFTCSVIFFALVLFYSVYGGYIEYARYVRSDLPEPRMYVLVVICLFAVFLILSLFILIKSFYSVLNKKIR